MGRDPWSNEGKGEGASIPCSKRCLNESAVLGPLNFFFFFFVIFFSLFRASLHPKPLSPTCGSPNLIGWFKGISKVFFYVVLYILAYLLF